MTPRPALARSRPQAGGADVPLKLGAVGVLVTAALLAAFLQSPIAAVAAGLPGALYLDDAAIVLTLLFAIPQLGKAPGMAGYLIGLWLLAMGFACINRTVPLADAFVLFRQVTMPALLILIGLALTARQWDRVRRLTIWLGVVNCLYMGLEAVGIYLFNPANLSTASGAPMVIRNGLPSYYFYWPGADSPFGGASLITRLGGTVLNPPIAGLVVATALVFLWHEKNFPLRRIWLLALAVTTLLTFSRGGWLVALVGLLLPVLFRTVGRVGAAVVMLPMLWLVGTRLAEDGNSSIHAAGVSTGLRDAVSSGIGVGFGSIGNYLKGLRLVTASESLLGIAFSAAGLVAVALVAILLLALWVYGSARRPQWEACIGVGILAAALFSETAGGLNGTIPLWLAIGVAIRQAPGVDPGRLDRQHRAASS